MRLMYYVFSFTDNKLENGFRNEALRTCSWCIARSWVSGVPASLQATGICPRKICYVKGLYNVDSSTLYELGASSHHNLGASSTQKTRAKALPQITPTLWTEVSTESLPKDPVSYCSPTNDGQGHHGTIVSTIVVCTYAQ